MPVEVIGECPLTGDTETRKPKYSTSCVFTDDNVLVSGEGRHNAQFIRYIAHLTGKQKKPLTNEEQESKLEQMVCLIHREDTIFIRPDINIDKREIEKILAADKILQDAGVPKQYIKFLEVFHEKVRQTMKKRGELWRINSLPHTTEEMKKMISDSRAALSDRAMYYYNMETGTRYLTFEEFLKLGSLPAGELAGYLNEIKKHSLRENKRGNPELAFFMADGSFNFDEYKDEDFTKWDEKELRFHYESFRSKFESAVNQEFRKDDPENDEWRKAMLSRLVGKHDEEITEESLIGLCPEFYMHIKWLPGARIEHGEVIFDSVFDEKMPEEEKIYDEKVRDIILNFKRRYDNIEYINIGSVIRSLSRREKKSGRREVYIAEIKVKGVKDEIVKMIRLQKWGAVELLESGDETDVFKAAWRAQEYKRYTLDRWIGCEQLGMNLKPITTEEIFETIEGIEVPLVYFERDYINGRASDKISASKFEKNEYALRFARLLGESAAPNIILGRVNDNKEVYFDDGDEVILESKKGNPAKIISADITSSFGDYTTPLEKFAGAYAQPVIKRAGVVPDVKRFAEIYVDAFVKRFRQIQQEYRTNRKAFDSLFKDRKYDEKGSFAYRWEKTLQRLDSTDADMIGKFIMNYIKRELKF